MAKITVTIEGSLIGSLTVETAEFDEDLGQLMIGAAQAAYPLAATAPDAVAAYVRGHMLTLMQQALRAKGAAEAQLWDVRAAELVI